MMLSEGREYVRNAWWLTTLPGLAIAITVLGINLLGDWLRDVLDPRTVMRR
jgi:peptide/nickel transport system permease protein